MVNMVSPEFASAVETDLQNGHQYSVAPTAGVEPPQSQQAGPVYHPHVRHPFPFSAIAGQLPAATGFPAPTNVDYRLPTATAATGNLFNPSPYGQQFPGEASNDRSGPPPPPGGNSYQTNVDPVQSPFDNLSNLFRMMPPPASAGNNPNFYASSQSLSYSSPASSFMSPRPDTAAFDSLMQSSSSQPWPPLADLHRPTFGPISRFQMPPPPIESSVGVLCSSPPHNSAVGSDSLSSAGSPITDLLDRGGNSPLPGARYHGCAAVTLPSPSMSDVMESVHRTVATSPFCASPVDGLQLSRSLPAGVRFGSSTLADPTAAVGHHYPVSRMHFDTMPAAASPVPRQSLYQPPSLLDDRTTATTAYQVVLFC